MAENSKIEWCHHTCNLWHGCTKVHSGCDHCYAETLSNRWGRDIWGIDKPRMEIKSVWNDFKRYQEAAAKAGEVHRVFVGSMMDIFEKPMPVVDSKGREIFDYDFVNPAINTQILRQRFFEEVVPACPNILFLLLTKRPSNINKMIPDAWKTDAPKNVMFGTSPCDQETAHTLIPQLLKVNGKKFLSIEPLLGPVELCTPIGIDWIIVGGESGHGARPMQKEWAISLKDQCAEAGIPFFFKQGSKQNWPDFKNFNSFPENIRIREFPTV